MHSPIIKVKHRFKCILYIIFAYYFGKILGLLPIKYSSGVESIRENLEDLAEFRPCKFGIMISVVQFFFEGWACYVVFKYLLESAMMRTEALCSQGHYCSAFGLLLSHTIIGILVVAIVPFRFKETIDCFNKATCILFKGQRRKRRSMTYFTIIPFIAFVIIKIVISNIGFHIKDPELYYPYNFSYFGPLTIIYIIGVLCSISKEAYEDINQELEQLCDRKMNKTYRIIRIRHLMNDHWYVSNFVDNISKCFALDILLVMLDIYVQLVLFLYVTLWAMFAQKTFSGLVWPHAAGLLEVTIITVKLVYLCDRCNGAVSSGNLTIFFLQHLSSELLYDSYAQEQIKMFTLKVNCRELVITANGFFTINLTLLVRIVGVVITYFLVLIQFQVDGETSLNGTKQEKGCPSWPCLKPA